jgi:hypothetical protein
MLQKFNQWRLGLSPIKKLLVSFILNWLWFFVWVIIIKMIFHEEKSLKYYLLFITSLSLLMSIIYNWKNVKEIFKKSAN